MKYTDFRLLVTQDGTIRCSSPAGEAAGELHLDRDEINLALCLIDEDQTNADLLKSLGGRLYQALFPLPVHSQFQAALAAAEAAGRGLRLRLVFDSAELNALPWELLYDKPTNTFLGNDVRTALSRYIDVPMRRRDVKPRGSPLRILVVISSPVDRRPLRDDQEEDLIRAALRTHTEAGSISIDVLRGATVRDIGQKLREQEYHVFQMIGHGTFEENQGRVVLEDALGNSRLLDDESFANFFLGNRSLGLVVLNVCRGAGLSSNRVFSGMAPHLVRRGIPAVVAMQYSIPDSAALAFTDVFYQSIALGWPVDAAIQAARNSISIDAGLDRVDFATPVLYTRAEDGMIFSTPRRKKTPPGQ